MHRAFTPVASFSALLLCASHSLSPTEARLVRKWHVQGKSASIDLTFRPDHTAHIVTRWNTDHEHQSWVSDGRWSAAEDRFFIDWYKNPDVVRHMREIPKKIVRLTSDILVLNDPSDPDEITAHRVK
jgi:hypothetical protein